VLLNITVKEVRDIYSATWVVLISSNTDIICPAGLTYLTEALSYSAAVVIPEGQSQEGYVRNGKDVITFSEISTDAVVSAMQTFKDDSFRQRVKDASRKRALDLLAAPVVTTRVFNALENILDSS